MEQETLSNQALDAILDQCGRGSDATIPILQAIQTAAGYIPRSAMEYVAGKSSIPAVQLYGVASFYTQFRLAPTGRHMIRVCHGTACHVAGAQAITRAVRGEAGLRGEADTTDDRFCTVEEVACLGCCSLAPVMTVDGASHGKLDPQAARKIIRRLKKEDKEG
ncbi:MAG: NAD(P)H-dependent oxidoreductase subunit E [Planctomycetota bacterium]